MRPILVIDGKPTRYLELERFVEAVPNPPERGDIYKTYSPGRQYMVVRHLSGVVEWLNGPVLRTVRHTGRPVLHVSRRGRA